MLMYNISSMQLLFSSQYKVHLTPGLFYMHNIGSKNFIPWRTEVAAGELADPVLVK